LFEQSRARSEGIAAEVDYTQLLRKKVPYAVCNKQQIGVSIFQEHGHKVLDYCNSNTNRRNFY